MKVGDRVRDILITGENSRGTGTITEINPIITPPAGHFYAVVEWDKPIPKGNPFGLTDTVSEEYLDDLELLENEK